MLGKFNFGAHVPVKSLFYNGTYCISLYLLENIQDCGAGMQEIPVRFSWFL
jgi:hypothetical protein